MIMESDRTPGLADYFGSLKRRRSVILAVAAPIILIAVIVAISLPGIYSAPAEFQFERSALAELEGDRHDPNNYADELVSKLSDAVTSPDNLKAFRQEVSFDGTSTDLKKAINVQMSTERILDPDSGRQKDVNSGFTVGFDSRSPEIAKKGSQWLADQFIAISRQSRRDKAMHTAKFLDGEAERYRVQIVALESKVADFKQKNYGQLPESVQTNLAVKDRAEQELNNVEQELRTIQQNQIFLESQLLQAQGSAGQDNDSLRQLEDEYRRKSVTYDESHPDMLALKKQIDTARRVGGTKVGNSLAAQLAMQQEILAETRQRYSEDHPDVKRIQRTIAALQARIANGEKTDVDTTPPNPIVVQLQTQLTGARNQAASLAIRRAELREKLSTLETRMGASPQVEKQYQELNRDVGLARAKYDETLKRKMDAEFAGAASLAGSGDVFRMVQAPTLPTSTAKPNRVAIVLIGVILAGMLSFLAALGAEAVDQSVRGSRDLFNILGVTPMAIIPEIRNSAFRKQRFAQLRGWAVSTLIGIPVLYLAIRFIVR